VGQETDQEHIPQETLLHGSLSIAKNCSSVESEGVIPLDLADDHINGDAHHIIQIKDDETIQVLGVLSVVALLAIPRPIDGGYLCPNFRTHLLPIPNC
jgi:hypothetical protein